MAHPAKEALFDELRRVEETVDEIVARLFRDLREHPEGLETGLSELSDALSELAATQILPRVSQIAVRAADRIGDTVHGG